MLPEGVKYWTVQHGEGEIFCVNSKQLQEIPQCAMSCLKWHHFTMGSVRAVPYKDVTVWGSRSKM